MKLLIVSHTEHHHLTDGRIGGWGATVREIDHLATLFDEVEHVAWLYSGDAPENALPYEAGNVRLIPVAPSGGSGWRARLGILAAWPKYALTILRQMKRTDVIHMRCPANISLLALFLLTLVRYPRLRWIKYAGNWSPQRGEAVSYALQRWWLQKGLARAKVTVNGRWPDQPAHIHSFLNPCLTEQELQAGREAAKRKKISDPVRLIFAGRLDREKGADRCLKILHQLREMGVIAHLDLAGDSPERRGLEKLATDLKVDSQVTFHGWLPHSAISRLYAQAHFILLPSQNEGWPKVLSEAMAYGVVSLASTVGSIPQYLEQFQTGGTFAVEDVIGYANSVREYVLNPEKWQVESENSVKAARLFSYALYLENVRALLGMNKASEAGSVVVDQWEPTAKEC